MKKYRISTRGVIGVIAIGIVFIILYCVLVNARNNIAIGVFNTENNPKYLLLIDNGINATTIAISVIFSSIVSAFILEKDDKNNQFLDSILNDIIAKNKMYKYLHKDTKKKLFRELESELYGREIDAVKKDIINDIRKKIYQNDDKYYYESCSYKVSCSIEEDYIEKEVNREIKLRSYQQTYNEKKYCVVASKLKRDSQFEGFEVKYMSVNGQPLKKGKDYIELDETLDDSAWEKRNEYDTKHWCELKKPLKLQSNKDTTIIIKYITRVNKKDNVYICRVKNHCKRFSLDFDIKGPEKYKISSEAFGFLDNAGKTLPSSNGNQKSVKFDEWIFKEDGVSITFDKK